MVLQTRLYVFSSKDYSVVDTIVYPSLSPHTPPVSVIEKAGRSQIATISLPPGQIRVFDYQERKAKYIKVHSKHPNMLKLSGNGTYLAAVFGYQVKVFQLRTDTQVIDFKAEGANSITNIYFSPSCEYMVVSSGVAGQPGYLEIVGMDKSQESAGGSGGFLSGWFRPYTIVAKVQIELDRPQFYNLSEEHVFFVASMQGQVHKVAVDLPEKKAHLVETKILRLGSSPKGKNSPSKGQGSR